MNCMMLMIVMMMKTMIMMPTMIPMIIMMETTIMAMKMTMKTTMCNVTYSLERISTHMKIFLQTYRNISQIFGPEESRLR